MAELARLIGQEDPFADFASSTRPVDTRVGANGPVRRREYVRPSRTPSSAPREADDPNRLASAAARSSPGIAEAAVAEAPRPNGKGAARHDFASSSMEAARTARSIEAAQDTQAALAAAAQIARPRPSEALDRLTRPSRPRFADRYEDGHRTRARQAPAQDELTPAPFSGADFDPEYAEDVHLPAHSQEFYRSAPRRRIRWVPIAVAVFGLAVLSVTGVFAYRALFGVGLPAGQPKVIKSEAGPSKVAPKGAVETAESPGQKQIYDRVGGEPAPGERIVSRQEEPVDVSLVRQPAPRAPASPSAAPASAVNVLSGQPVTANQNMLQPVQSVPTPPAAPLEPRRVRTVTVRSDGSVVANAATQRAAQPALSNQPLAVTSYAAPPAQPPNPEPPPPPTRTAAAPASTPAPAAQSQNPWADIPNTRPAPQPATVASVPPSQPASRPPSIAVNRPIPAGSYVVQVSSQKTEADAQSSWVNLQQRYPSILGNQTATIRRYNLGERGTFYRALVGPFASRAQASEVCQSLKAAGGECVIHRN